MDPLNRPHVTDDRGRRVSTLVPPLREPQGLALQAITPDLFRAVCARVGARVEVTSRGWQVTGGVLTIIIGLLLTVPGVWNRGLLMLWLYGVPGLFAGVMLVRAGMRFRPRFPGANADDLARAVAAEGLCPSCAYTIRGLATEPDGCVVCPECGSAWRGVGGVGGVTTPPTSGPVPPGDAAHRTPGAG